MMTNVTQDSEMRDSFLIANLTDFVDRLRYTYKTQEKAASRYSFYESVRKWILIGCTVLATGTFVTSVFAFAGSEHLGTLSVGFLAMLATLASFLGDVLNFSKKQQQHHDAGVRVRSLFVRSEALLSDYLAGAITASDARRSRDELQDSTDQLLLVIPRTSRRDYKKANKSMSTDERTSVAQEAVMRTISESKLDTQVDGDVQ
ncbi:MAG: SLATT domain-containing protein [Corynebacterium sp.]|nr:SLATT domain-containing protein [Corynebacterium sp.]